jgi:hypothetical protein
MKQVPLIVAILLVLTSFVAEAEADPGVGWKTHSPSGWESSGYVRRSPTYASRSSHRDELAAWYARKAVRQAHVARRFDCASSHPRWSTSYLEHFRWAVQQKPRKLHRELQRRERKLSHCRIWR